MHDAQREWQRIYSKKNCPLVGGWYFRIGSIVQEVVGYDVTEYSAHRLGITFAMNPTYSKG